LWMQVLGSHVRLLDNPANGLTSRFTPGWTQFGTLKSDSRLQFECATMLAHGLTCSVADQPDPSLVLDPDAYARIGHAYRWVAEREPWCRGATSAADLAVVWTGASVGASDTTSLLGAAKLLSQTHCAFDVVDETMALGAYPWAVVPSLGVLSDAQAEALRAYLEAGGRVLAMLPRAPLSARVASALGWEVGDAWDGPTAYLDRLAPAVQTDVDVRLLAVPGDALHTRAVDDGEVLAWMCPPLSGPDGEHAFGFYPAPPDRARAVPGVVRCTVGSGTLVVVTCDLFGAYLADGDPNVRRLGRNLLEILHPRAQRVLDVDAPPWVHVSLMTSDQRHVVHLLNEHTQRRDDQTPAMDQVPPVDRIAIQLACKARPAQVYLAPPRRELPFQYRAGRLHCVVPQLHVHRMLVVAMHVE